MTQQTISTGSSANDGTGDTLRAAATKINANFTEVYSKSSRVVETETTANLADTATGNIDFGDLGKTFLLQEIKPDRKCWVSIYLNGDSRTKDSRTDIDSSYDNILDVLAPNTNRGLMYEFKNNIGDSAQVVSPGVMCWLDSATSSVPVRVKNLSGGTSTVQIRIKALKVEI